MSKDYKKQEELCKKLGAEKFQKVVFKVENIKYKLLKKMWPNFIVYFDKRCDKQKQRQLKKAKTEEERKKIIEDCRNRKMAARKELNREQNINYHMDMNKPMEMLYYLDWNKNIHKRGVIQNSILIPLLIVAASFGYTIAIPFLVEELFSLFVNFQCINIQNYNISRIKLREEQLTKIAERRQQSNIKKYGEAAKVIDKAMSQTEEIPSFKQIIENAKTPEELQQLRELVLKTRAEHKQATTKKQGRK